MAVTTAFVPPVALRAPLRTRTTILHVAAIPVSLALWLLSLQHVALSRLGDLGLAPLLPLPYYLALAILLVSYCVLIHAKRDSHWLHIFHLAMVILIIRATPEVLYGTLRYSWAYKHVSIVDYIFRHGSVNRYDTYLGVYQNWPGFFALNATIQSLTGLSTQGMMLFANLAPPFFNGIDLLALYLLVRVWTRDDRLIWLSLLVFSLGNWVGQDYFAPQAAAYFLYLVMVGIVLRYLSAGPILVLAETLDSKPWWKRIRRSGSSHLDKPDFDSKYRRVLAIAMVAILCVVIVCSHQLTPLMAVSGFTLLVLARICSMRTLPLWLLGLTLTWDLYAAEPFVHTQVHLIMGTLGNFTGNISTSLGHGYAPPPGQQLVAFVARAFTGLIMILAVTGAIRRMRVVGLDLSCALLLLAPLPLPLVTQYGSEVLFRVLLFALPFASFFAAAAVYPTPSQGRSLRTLFASMGLSGIMAIGLMISYYGLEAGNYLTAKDVAVVRYFYAHAPRHSLLIQGSSDAPLPYHNYEYYTYLNLQEEHYSVRARLNRHPVRQTSHLCRSYALPRCYVIFTHSELEELHLIGLQPLGMYARLERALDRSRHYRLLYRNSDGALFQLWKRRYEVKAVEMAKDREQDILGTAH